MRRAISLAGLLSLASLAACNAILGIGDLADPGPLLSGDAGPVTQNADAANDASADAHVEAEAAPPPDCDVTKEFGAPVLVTSLSTVDDEGSARLSDDELTVYFDAHRDSDWKLLTATRSTRDGEFGLPSEIQGVQSADNEYSPTLRADGLEILFERRTGGSTSLYQATRATNTAGFDTPTTVGNVNSGNYTANPFTRGDGSEIWYVTANESAPLMYFAKFTPGVGYTTSEVVPANIGHAQQAPVISANGLLLFFASDKVLNGVSTGLDIWLATRTSASGTFGQPIPVGILNSAQNDKPTWLSVDGCRLYLASNRPGGTGGQDIYLAKRPH